jgi:hypothetical protein
MIRMNRVESKLQTQGTYNVLQDLSGSGFCPMIGNVLLRSVTTSRLLASDLSVTASKFIANPEASVPDRIASTPPLGANLLTLNNLRRGAGFGGPELESFDCEHVLDRLLPMVERKIKEAPMDGHE